MFMRSSLHSSGFHLRRHHDFSIVFDDSLERSEVRRITWFCFDEESCEPVITNESITDINQLESSAREAASSLQRYSDLYNRLSQSIQTQSATDQEESRQRLRMSRNVVRFAASQCDLNGRFCETSYVEAMESLVAQDYQKFE